MTDTNKVVNINFNFHEKGLDEIGRKSKETEATLAEKIESSTEAFAGMSDAILKTSAAIGLLGVAATAFSINEAIKLEDALIGLRKVSTKKEQDNIKEYAATITDLGVKFAITGDQALEATTVFKEAGFNMQDAIELTEGALLLAATGGVTVGEASDILSKQLAGFKRGAEDTTLVVDILTQASNNFGVNVTQLGEAMSRTASISESAGLSYERQAALLSVLIERNKNGAVSGTSFSAILSKLVGTNAVVERQLKKLGISQRDSNGAFREGGAILLDVIKNTDKLTRAEKLRVAGNLFGIEQAKIGVALLGAQSDQEAKYQKLLKAGGSARKEFEERTKATSFALDQLNVAFRTTSATFGSIFLNETSAAAKALSGLFGVLKNELEGGSLNVLTSVFENTFASVETTINNIAQNLPKVLEQINFDDLAKSFESLFSTISDLFGLKDLQKEQGLKDGVQGIVDSLTSLNNLTEGVIISFKQFIDVAVKPFLAGINSSGDGVRKFSGAIIGWGKIVNETAPKIASFAESMTLLAQSFAILSGAKALDLIAGGKLSAGIGSLAKSAGKLAPTAAGMSKFVGVLGLLGLTAVGAYEGIQLFLSEDDDNFFKDIVLANAQNVGEAWGNLKNNINGTNTEVLNHQKVMNFYIQQKGREAKSYEEALEFLQKYTEEKLKSQGVSEDATVANEKEVDSIKKVTKAKQDQTKAEEKQNKTQDIIDESIIRYNSYREALVGLSSNFTKLTGKTKTFEEGQKNLNAIMELHVALFGEQATGLETAKVAIQGLINGEKEYVDKSEAYGKAQKLRANGTINFTEEARKLAETNDANADAEKRFVEGVLKSNNSIFDKVQALQDLGISADEAFTQVAQFERDKFTAEIELEKTKFEKGIESTKNLLDSISGARKLTVDIIATQNEQIFDRTKNIGFVERQNLRRERDEELDHLRKLEALQRETQTAEIERLKAETKRIQKAAERGPVIVEGQNLQPELQALLRSFLENIRISATQQGREFIIGT